MMIEAEDKTFSSWDAILCEKPLNIFKPIGKAIPHNKKC